MRTFAAAAVAIVAAVAGLSPLPRALADKGPDHIDTWVRDSSVVVAAEALVVDGQQGRFRVLQVLKGSLGDREIAATPLVTQSCVGPHDQVPFPAGTEVVLFLGKSDGKVHPVTGSGIAWLRLDKQRRAEVLEAIGQVVGFEALASPEERIGAYITAVEKGSPTLRRIAYLVIPRDLADKGKAAPWEDRLVPLIRSPVMEARLAALLALRFSKSEKALPALLEAVGDADRTVRDFASMALAPYDTEVTVRRLVEAARKPDMVGRILNDLRGSAQPAAWEFLATLFKSEDPKVRAKVLGCLSVAVHRGAPVVLEIHGLLGDAVEEVRLAALHALRGSPLPETEKALLEFLRRNDLCPHEREAAMKALCSLDFSTAGSGEALRILREAEDLSDLVAKYLRECNVGGDSLRLLILVNSPSARSLLVRVRDGEFGQHRVEEAKRLLDLVRPK